MLECPVYDDLRAARPAFADPRIASVRFMTKTVLLLCFNMPKSWLWHRV
jgi:hypothetical protein